MPFNVNKETNEISAPCCPYCGRQLELGYIQSYKPIYFNKGNKARFLASGDLQSFSISSLGAIKAPAAKAAYCASCRKIIVEIEK